MENKQTVVNIKKIAEDLGLSTTTVSRAISGNGRIGKQTVDKVHAYMESKGIVPNVYKKSFADKKTYNICVVVPLEEDYAELPYFQKIILSIYDFFSMYGYQIMVIKTTWSDNSALEKVVNEKLVDGVVLTRTIANGEDIKFLQQSEMPFVVTGSYDDKTVLQVDVDQFNSSFDMTMSLLRMGIRNMALFMAEKTQVVNINRYKGFEKAYDIFDLDMDMGMIYDHVGYPSIAESLALKMVKQGVECILCMDDNICLYVLNALRKHGVEVPKDIKVASLYNSRLLDEYYPSISCVEFDINRLGTAAGRVLLERLNGDMNPKKIVLGYNVILKDSTK